MTDPLAYYQTQLQAIEKGLIRIQRRYLFISNVRLAVFIGGAALTYFLFREEVMWGLLTGVISLFGFLYLLRIHATVADQRDHQRRLRRILKEEIKAQNRDFSDFDSGKDCIDAHHAFSYDMDIFGERSLFQYVARSTSEPGRSRWINWLLQPEQDTSVIQQRQTAAQELSQHLDWTLEFQALGRAHRATHKEIDSLEAWLKKPAIFSAFPLWSVLVWLLPTLFFGSLIGWIITDIPVVREALGGFRIPGFLSVGFFLSQLLVAGRNLKRVNGEFLLVTNKSRLLATYGQLLQAVEQAPFESEPLRKLKSRLGDAPSASATVTDLGEMVYRFDQRLNMIMGVLLNGMLMWDLRFVLRFETWRAKHQQAVMDWFEVLTELDALLNISRLASNRPEFVWPELGTGDFFYEADGLGHPLLPVDTRVDNSVNLQGPGAFLIITGANMAGKSTFLRSVGVSLMMAMAGAPVCARRLRMAPVPMITSVRATDSLADNESYFYAELKQLKRIIDQLETQGPAFVIVDEMLRGTNSRDKQVGSRRFIEQLIRLKGVGLVATHDLSLGTLAEDYPEQVRNKRFEVDITDDQLTFDYKLRDGISQNLNATFLMQQMGIMPRE